MIRFQNKNQYARFLVDVGKKKQSNEAILAFSVPDVADFILRQVNDTNAFLYAQNVWDQNPAYGKRIYTVPTMNPYCAVGLVSKIGRLYFFEDAVENIAQNGEKTIPLGIGEYVTEMQRKMYREVFVPYYEKELPNPAGDADWMRNKDAVFLARKAIFGLSDSCDDGMQSLTAPDFRKVNGTTWLGDDHMTHRGMLGTGDEILRLAGDPRPSEERDSVLKALVYSRIEKAAQCDSSWSKMKRNDATAQRILSGKVPKEVAEKWEYEMSIALTEEQAVHPTINVLFRNTLGERMEADLVIDRTLQKLLHKRPLDPADFVTPKTYSILCGRLHLNDVTLQDIFMMNEGETGEMIYAKEVKHEDRV